VAADLDLADLAGRYLLAVLVDQADLDALSPIRSPGPIPSEIISCASRPVASSRRPNVST